MEALPSLLLVGSVISFALALLYLRAQVLTQKRARKRQHLTTALALIAVTIIGFGGYVKAALVGL